MKALAAVLVFFGYMLVYAAIAKSGKFALEPWAGLFADAYTTDSTATPSQPASSTQRAGRTRNPSSSIPSGQGGLPGSSLGNPLPGSNIGHRN